MACASCPTCSNLEVIVPPVSGGLPQDPIKRINLAELCKESLRDERCPSCSLLWRCISAVTEFDTPHPDITFTHLVIDPNEHGDLLGKGPLIAHLSPNQAIVRRTPLDPLDLHFYTSFEDPPSPWPTIGSAYHISRQGLSDSSLSLMRQWLDQCTAAEGKHVNCGIPGSTRLPNRLVHVGDSNTRPRLYLPGPGETGRYAALSHCWGGKGTIRTLLSNLSDSLTALPEPLPQTFADAVAVTRALNIEYIWIDSLCIIQDDPDDWATEAVQMADVYTNAYVTISADAAGDAAAGFLQAPSRQAPPHYNVPVNVTSNSAATGTITGGGTQAAEAAATIHVRTRGFLAEELPFHCWKDSQQQPGTHPPAAPYSSRHPIPASGRSKLSTRGWVFQERILSRRTIHFAAHETAWECQSLCDCECSATAARTKRTTSVVKHFLALPRPGSAGTTPAGRSGDAVQDETGSKNEIPATSPRDVEKSHQVSWRHNIVQAYTRLDLTVATDRLPALAGLADAAGRFRPAGDRYLAGLWRSSLVADLLWRVADQPKSRRLPAGYAPSWSWGSVTGAVTFDNELEAAIEDQDENRGVFVVEDVRFKDGLPSALTACCCAIPVRVLPHGSNSLGEVEPVDGPAGVKLSVAWDDVDGRRRRDQAQCLFVVFGTRSPSHGPFGILLGARTGIPKVTFQRLGFVDGYQLRRWLRRWDSGGWEWREEESDPVFSSSKVSHSYHPGRDLDGFGHLVGSRKDEDAPLGMQDQNLRPTAPWANTQPGQIPVRGTQQGPGMTTDREAWIRAVLDSPRCRVEIF